MSAAIQIINEPEAAAASLTPIRRRILGALRRPGSATSVAADIGLTRQKVNYHLRELERLGLAEHVEDRKRGNCTERILRAKAECFLIDPGMLGTPESVALAADRASSEYLALAAARTVSDVATLQQGAHASGKRLPTYTLEAAVRFATPADQAAFTEELGAAVTELVARYQSSTPDARWFRVLLGTHPAVRRTEGQPHPAPPTDTEVES